MMVYQSKNIDHFAKGVIQAILTTIHKKIYMVKTSAIFPLMRPLIIPCFGSLACLFLPYLMTSGVMLTAAIIQKAKYEFHAQGALCRPPHDSININPAIRMMIDVVIVIDKASFLRKDLAQIPTSLLWLKRICMAQMLENKVCPKKRKAANSCTTSKKGSLIPKLLIRSPNKGKAETTVSRM